MRRFHLWLPETPRSSQRLPVEILPLCSPADNLFVRTARLPGGLTWLATPYSSLPPLPRPASHLRTGRSAGFRDRNLPGPGDGARLAFPPSAAPSQVPGDTGT